MDALNTITVTNSSNLDPGKYTVWVAGFIEQRNDKQKPVYWSLKSDGSFALSTDGNSPFIKINNGINVNVPDLTNYGNNRLVFTVTKINSTQPDALSAVTGYTAYPFPGVPGVSPSGPYDIFEFGPEAQYDVSAVDSLGMNLSFTVLNDALTYGPVPSFTREQISTAFKSFVRKDPLGSNGFAQLLYTSPTGTGYPDVIAGQFSAIVSPKGWLAIHPSAPGLHGYWDQTIKSFFNKSNQISLYLNAAMVGRYSGTSDGTKYTLYGPSSVNRANRLKIIIPESDFAGNQGFIQAVRAIHPGEGELEYKTFNQIEAAIFGAISRGVLLDGVVAGGTTITDDYSSDAWTKVSNWYTIHKNAYNNEDSVYDAYAKFMHNGTVTTNSQERQNIFGKNSAGSFGMAYGFSLDESPNVSKNWTTDNNVPSKPNYNIGKGQNVSLVIGPWIPAK